MDNLLITTSHSLILWRSNANRIEIINRGHGLYYGLTCSPETIFVAARNRLVSSPVPRAEERGEILVYDKNLIFKESLKPNFPLRDMHQILWYEGLLWITCSFDNMVAIYNGDYWETWFPLGRPDNEPFDINHFNSFFVKDEYLYILAHNNGSSELLKFSINNRELLARLPFGLQSHNIWVQGNEFFTCSSGESKIMSTNGFQLQTGGFPRGVAITNNNAYIGISKLAERKDRDFTDSMVLIYDKNWSYKKTIQLADEGLILDIMPVKSYILL